MKLEQQLAKLNEIGLQLNDGVSVQDLLNDYEREEYERQPYDLILWELGGEIERENCWKPICSQVWNFDTECIEQTGDYTRIIKRLCAITGKPDYLKEISDFIDWETEEGWVKYTVNGREQIWDIELNDDWADTLTLGYVMDDLQHDGYRFYSKDSGQTMLLFYLDPATAEGLNRLSSNALEPIISE